MSADKFLQLLLERERNRGPLLIFHGAKDLPETPPEAIKRAEALGRPIAHIHFVRAGDIAGEGIG
jgi:pimeloyl-ACP methyl ester carboxylesterase